MLVFFRWCQVDGGGGCGRRGSKKGRKKKGGWVVGGGGGGGGGGVGGAGQGGVIGGCGCENDWGPDRGEAEPDVTWHLAGKPPGGQAVRTADSQPSTSQVMQPGGGRSRRRRSPAGASAKPHSLLSFSVTHRGAVLGRRGGTRRPNLCPLENVK